MVVQIMGTLLALAVLRRCLRTSREAREAGLEDVSSGESRVQ